MTPTELSDLVQTLQSSTPLGRLNHAEALAVLVKMSELGFVPATVNAVVTK